MAIRPNDRNKSERFKKGLFKKRPLKKIFVSNKILYFKNYDGLTDNSTN